MRFYLCLVIAVVCEAARVPRVTEQSYFPNFQNLYQGRNYGNEQADGRAGVPFFGDYKTQEGNLHLGNEYYGRQTPLAGQANFANHLTGVPLGGVAINNADFRTQHADSQNYQRFNHAFNYDYQL